MKLGGLDQRCEAGPVDGTVVVAGEQAIFSIQRDRAHRSLDTVSIHLDATVVEETYEAVPVVEAIADRLRDGALLRDGGQPGLEPSPELFHQRLRFGLSDGATFLRAAAADPALDGIECRDPSNASWAIGAGPPLSISKKWRLQCNQQKASVTAPRSRPGSASCFRPHSRRIARCRNSLSAKQTRARHRGRAHRYRRRPAGRTHPTAGRPARSPRSSRSWSGPGRDRALEPASHRLRSWPSRQISFMRR